MKRIFVIVLSVLLLAATAFGCQSKSAAAPQSNGYYYGYDTADNAVAEAAYDMVVEEPMEAKAASTSAGRNDYSQAQSPSLQNRKIIRNADVSVQTLEFDKFLETLNSQVESFGGFVENSSISGRGYYNKTMLRTAYVVVRVPAESLDTFLNVVDGLGNVTYKSTGMRDVTTNYIDSEKHLEALRTEQEALLEILKSATTVEDLITVQNRLSEVRYQIESYESIIRSYDDQIDLSTVNLTINEVERETVVEPETFWEEVGRRFKESMEDVGENLRDLGAWIMGNAPHIVVFLLVNGVIVLIIVLIIRGAVRRSKKRRAKRAEQNTNS